MTKFTITGSDLLKAHRRAARLEDIESHGRSTVFRSTLTRSRKTYTRKRKHRGLEDF